MSESDIYEYEVRQGKMFVRENGETINVLKNNLNELGRKGYEFVYMNQYIFDEMQFTLIMKRKVN